MPTVTGKIVSRFVVDPEFEKQYLRVLIRPYEQLNFVQRFLKPEQYGVLPMEGNKVGTHLMSHAETDKGYVVYPRIIQRSEDSPLELLSPDEARTYALKNKQFIPVDSEAIAQFLAENYKKVAGKY